MNIELKYAGDYVRFEDVALPPVKKSIFKRNKFPEEIDFYICVKSGEFAGRVRTMILGREAFENLLCEVKKLYAMELEELEFKTAYGDILSLNMDKQGHLSVSGLIVEPVSGQNLNFVIVADQSGLPPFIRELENLVNNSAK